MEEELQKLWVEFDYMNQLAAYYKAQLDQVLKAIEELQILKVGLKNIKETEAGEELLVPLGASVYAFSSLKDNKEVLVGVGAGVFVRKRIEEALPLVDKQIESLKKQQEIIVQNLSVVNQRLDELQRRIAELQRQTKEGAVLAQ